MAGGSAGHDESAVTILDGSREVSRERVGGKAWSINWMRSLGLRVPAAVVISSDVGRAYRDTKRIPDAAWAAVRVAVEHLEQETDRRFGGAPRPLLVSVRSGAPQSMPGMMDTILNLGINDDVEHALAAETGNEAFAVDVRRRFDEQFRAVTITKSSIDVPQDPFEQLRMAIEAVFRSWDSPRAHTYRDHHKIPHDGSTAVTIQAMVYGNLDAQSGTGVLFSRNPITGDARPYGEWLPGAQGEDVVSGRHTPRPLDDLRVALPRIHAELIRGAERLEREARDAQDIEFTVERGQLWFLQTRRAKRSARAAVRIAVQLCDGGVISADEALARIEPGQVTAMLGPQLDPAAIDRAVILATGEPASPGFASGVVVTDADSAVERSATEDVVLVRSTTSPEDVHGMIAATGVVTATGGGTSHAAVVCRELDRPCAVGCGERVLEISAGTEVTLDGTTGTLFAGRLPVVVVDAHDDPDLRRLAEWTSEHT
jgi:pyruvate, orthophosphate dikinase